MKHNFTLVELLVTVGIIAILAGLVIPAVISSQNQGRITQAKSDMNAIKLALKSVETTYGSIKYDGATVDATTGTATIDATTYDNFMAELYVPQKVSSIKFNKRKIKFLDPSADFDPEANYATQNQWRDPWGNCYVILLDTKFQGYVKINNKNRAGSFQIYSCGPDGVSQQGDNEDQGGAEGSDDIATWHK